MKCICRPIPAKLEFACPIVANQKDFFSARLIRPLCRLVWLH